MQTTRARSSNDTLRQIQETVWRGPFNWAKKNGVFLRPYQQEISRAIVDSVINKRGLTFAIVLPRQSGKNELQSHILSWLMFRYARKGCRIVSVSPTFKPQVINQMDRVRASLDRSPVTRGAWKGSAGFIYKYQASRLQFFSADPAAKVVGATADLLLSVDEAQDVTAAKFDKDFDPMTASTNATRVFWGTVWTADTLLHRQMQIAKQEQEADGIQRLFFYTADDVRKLVPSYGEHVDRVIREKGRQHPLVKTQYFCETIEAQVGMFNAGRLALMQGNHSDATEQPIEGHLYAFLIDVAGQDEAMLNLDGMGNPGRDFTRLAIVDIDLSTLETLQKPTYRIVHRVGWQGLGHLALFGQLKAMGEKWTPQYIVIDATGVGEGLWALMDKAFPARVIPIKFTQQTKSEIGYSYLAIIETGRLRDCCPTDETRIQYSKCQSEILPGPAHTMRWGVKDGTRDANGQLVHDDIVVSDALTAELDQLEWSMPFETVIISYPDPDKDAVKNF